MPEFVRFSVCNSALGYTLFCLFGGANSLKKLLLTLLIIFTILTFAGVIYVLKNHGTVNAGYAVVPCVIAVAISTSITAKYKKK